ncbi:MAG: endonuclease/exonuclease/phosphatase family protein [Flavobacteriaceae bacterium]|jgi:endonuclease/exonuclease/phosphatase family metal-dependent hydrolase|nr:endonuclease/exonuclease/phosphatase family protein [Flavobacteriaceae bacterium]
MRNFITAIIQVIVLSLCLSSCNYEDDFKNKNPNKEPVKLFTLTAVVVNKIESPLAKAEVILYDEYLKEMKKIESSATGAAVFADLKAGRYTLKSTFESQVNEVAVEIKNEDLEVRIKLDITPKDVVLQNSPIIITGIQADPRGTDAAANGTSSTYDGGKIVVNHIGGYEYVQLMALEDIDFSITPYSLVLANNGIVGDRGWAQGGSVTYKFDLISGKAKKGTFFYVGGKSKVLSGYGSCGKSTDISSSNWIATKDYKLEAGDGFGDPSSGILGNIGKDGQNVADGVAVFRGTTVTSESIPLDAVFYGTSLEGVYDVTNNWGYRVPEQNDRYAVKDKEGKAQPFFGQGTNTHLFSQPGSDVGDFIKLGGTTDRKQWTVLRNSSIVQLSYCAGESLLSDIEKAKGVTVFTENGSTTPEVPQPTKGTVSIMSFNIRHHDASDPFSLDNRKDYILQVILDEMPDIVGLQEFSDNWFETWMQQQMTAKGYGYYMDEANSFGSPKVIFYKKDRFDMRSSATYQMKYTENRSGAWVILYDKQKQREYFVTNSHWTTVSSDERTKMAKEVLSVIKQNYQSLPVLCIGDFNGQPISNEINEMKSNTTPKLLSAINESLKTFHGWGPTGSSTLDYIFYSAPFKLVEGKVIRTSFGAIWPSDHWPVMATFNVE